MSPHPEKGGEKQTDVHNIWPVHEYETDDGQRVDLTYANTVVRRFKDGYRHMDHVYCFEHRLGSAAVRSAIRIFDRHDLVNRFIDEGYSDHNLLDPTAEDQTAYEAFLRSRTDKTE